jgi:metal-responsive CopG/Arc/MetJ family transcriptional regulator
VSQKKLSDFAAKPRATKNISIDIDSELHREIHEALKKAGFKSWKNFVQCAGKMLIEDQKEPAYRS